jgi:hypothetical protein
MTKKLTRKFKPKTTIMKDKNGTLITKETEIAREFRAMFQTLLNRTSDLPQINTEYISVEPEDKEPSLQEIGVASKMLKNNKEVGNDEIASELLKYERDNLKIEIWKVIKEIWVIEKIPEDWNTSIICQIHKKIYVIDYGSYRGISLLSITNIILNRQRPYAVDIIGDYQSSFLVGRSTIDHIFILKQLIEKYYL